MGSLENLRKLIDSYVNRPSPAAAADLALKLRSVAPADEFGDLAEFLQRLASTLGAGSGSPALDHAVGNASHWIYFPGQDSTHPVAVSLADGLVASLAENDGLGDIDWSLAHESVRDFRDALRSSDWHPTSFVDEAQRLSGHPYWSEYADPPDRVSRADHRRRATLATLLYGLVALWAVHHDDGEHHATETQSANTTATTQVPTIESTNEASPPTAMTGGVGAHALHDSHPVVPPTIFVESLRDDRVRLQVAVGAAEEIAATLQSLADRDDVDQLDRVNAERLASALRSLAGMDPPSPRSLNGTVIDAAALLHRYDPPREQVIDELVADGVDVTTAREQAELLDSIATEISAQPESDGDGWQAPYSTAPILAPPSPPNNEQHSSRGSATTQGPALTRGSTKA